MTSVDVAHMLSYHADMDAVATVGIYTHEHRVPYGVIELDGAHVTTIREKPVIRQFVSAGIYVLSPDALDLVADQQRVDMPDLLLGMIARNMRVVAFPIREYWIDIVKPDDLQRARQDVSHVFRTTSSTA
jgi:NDP-sugar pyrophosphorylase family protein